MKILLIIFLSLGLSSCDKAEDFIYENFSLQKNIDMADEESRKNIDGDFEIDEFGYIFPPTVDRFVQNGFTYKAAIEDKAYDENTTSLGSGEVADISFTKNDSVFYAEVENNTMNSAVIEKLPITYIEVSKADLNGMDFSLGDIKFDDALYDIKARVPDKEIIELRHNTKDLQNDQYYMYLNGQYVVVFTMYQGKLSEIEIIPNERLANYEKN